MKTVDTIGATRFAVQAAREKGRQIGLVPTMGALHEGHLSLIRSCRKTCDFTVVSIFVNPTQFAPSEDLDSYPRPFAADSRYCEELGVNLIFAPSTAEMYPDANRTWVKVEKLGDHLCGASRPHFFRGVCTVVAKLFHIVTPDKAYFGQKDYQQTAILRRMVCNLNLPVEIVTCPTVREPDGLAMSSRNRYLNPDQRKQATCLHQALQKGAELIKSGQTKPNRVISEMRGVIAGQPEAKIDYISIVDSELLQPVEMISEAVLIALAVQIGPARLIDNILVDPSGKSS